MKEKDEAKALGARWKPEYKKWSVFLGKDYYKFDKWIPKDKGACIICNYTYLIVGLQKCFKCRKDTSVVGLGIEKYMVISTDGSGRSRYEYCNDDIHICPFINEIPKNICDFLADNYSSDYP